MRRPVIELEVQTTAGSVVRGYGSRELLTELLGSPPVWLPLSRGWAVQTWRIGNVQALAEHRGYAVLVVAEEGPALTPPRPVPSCDTGCQRRDTGSLRAVRQAVGLW